MILLLGPASWCQRVHRILTDRTNLEHHKVVFKSESLRGMKEHIEVIACSGGYNLTPEQIEAWNHADYLNHLMETS